MFFLSRSLSVSIRAKVFDDCLIPAGLITVQISADKYVDENLPRFRYVNIKMMFLRLTIREQKKFICEVCMRPLKGLMMKMEMEMKSITHISCINNMLPKIYI